MRERRWETSKSFGFGEVLKLGERLRSQGFVPAHPAKDIICYVEDWTVDQLAEWNKLELWPREDVTLIQILDSWQGDFFLLAGRYHTVYQQYRDVGTYCSLSHPWNISFPLRTHHRRAMLWLGFRHSHGFIRVRVQTNDVVTPGETRLDFHRSLWVAEREQIFAEAIACVALPITTSIRNGLVILHTSDSGTPFFCSWPDAFGPCQFEFNSPDAFEFLVPASRLATTHGDTPPRVRVYLTGFTETQLEEFRSLHPEAVSSFRCSVHCQLDEVPEVLSLIAPKGRLYATLCEFRAEEINPDAKDASAIIGVVGEEGAFRIEVRCNRAPLPEEDMAGWLNDLLGMPVVYAPLLPFP